jgi:hypothetical protein
MWSHLNTDKNQARQNYGLKNVWPSTGEIWLKMSRLRHAVYRWCIVTLIIAHVSLKKSRLRHAVYRWCIVTLIIAHVSPTVSLQNVTFETRRVTLCIVTLIIAHVSLNFMAQISLMSRCGEYPRDTE